MSNSETVAPADRVYGLHQLLLCREFLPPEMSITNGDHLKAVDPRKSSKPVIQERDTRRTVPGADAEEDSDVSEGDPYELTEREWWGRGRRGSWWRVRDNLGECIHVRDGVSLRSPSVRTIAPGELLQQAGVPRALVGDTRGRGSIRMPVRPHGWVTADTTRAGGAQYLVRAATPCWQVVYNVPRPGGRGVVVVRAKVDLQSQEIGVLNFGDVVEQSAPSVNVGKGIVRLPIVTKSDGASTGEARRKIVGWVTADASEAGGPTFFELVDKEAEHGGNNRQRGQMRKQQQHPRQ